MPSQPAHFSAAKRDEAFAASIDEQSHGDWVIIVWFYAALHYVDRELAKQNVHPRTHIARDLQVSNHQRLRLIAKDYLRLKNGSINARYEALPGFPSQQALATYRINFENIQRELGK